MVLLSEARRPSDTVALPLGTVLDLFRERTHKQPRIASFTNPGVDKEVTRAAHCTGVTKASANLERKDVRTVAGDSVKPCL